MKKIIGKNKIKSIQAQSPELAVLMSEYATRDEVYAAFHKKGNTDFGKIVDLTVCATVLSKNVYSRRIACARNRSIAVYACSAWRHG